MTSTDTTSKPFKIEKRQVYEAYKAVKSNHGAAGVDGQTLEMFERDLAGNLYRIWNRMSSGTYFPPPVRAVPIPKKTGGERILGVPTVSDRIAQMVVKQAIEPKLESIFLPDSHGYRPGNRPWMPWVLHVSGAGSTTGYWSSTSKACLTIFRMISC
jgi:RNA-directed DNA polymerase